jgi:uncharacterized RDD family membrane protein YckC
MRRDCALCHASIGETLYKCRNESAGRLAPLIISAMEERHDVSTPENVLFSYDIAGIGSRFISALIDLAIYLVIQVAIGALFLLILQRAESLGYASTVGAIYIATSFLLYWLYYIVFELVWGGQSPGKRIMRIRVVRLDGTPASPGQIIIRNIGRLVDIFPGFYATGLIVMFINAQSRRLGDLAAGTLVVREGRQLSLDLLSKMQTTHHQLSTAAMAEAASLPVYRLSQDQRQLIHDYMNRRTDMNELQRSRLSLQIAQAVAKQMDQVMPTHPEQADYLLELISGVLDS